MPELPEIETVRGRLETQLRDFEIRQVDLRSTRLRAPIPPQFAKALGDARIQAIRRRGKYLLIDLNNRNTWIVHFGMSGRLLLGESPVPDGHDHLILRGSCGTVLRYHDFRRFGRFEICETQAVSKHGLLAKLGIDALAPELDSKHLHSLLLQRRTTIKSALLNQQLIAGLGNIYACESLYWASLNPNRLSEGAETVEEFAWSTTPKMSPRSLFNPRSCPRPTAATADERASAWSKNEFSFSMRPALCNARIIGR